MWFTSQCQRNMHDSTPPLSQYYACAESSRVYVGLESWNQAERAEAKAEVELGLAQTGTENSHVHAHTQHTTPHHTTPHPTTRT